MSNRYLNAFHKTSTQDVRSSDSSSRNYYEIYNFIDAICSSSVDSVSQDLLNTICTSLISNRQVSATKVRVMLLSSLVSAIESFESSKFDEENEDVLDSLRKTREDVSREQKLSEHDLNLIKQSDQECKDQLDLLRNQRVDNAIVKSLKQRYFKQPEELDAKKKVRLN